MSIEAEVATAEATETPEPKAKKAKVKAKAPAKKAKANGHTNGKAPAKKAKADKVTKARAPRTRDPEKLDEYGFRKGSIKSRAAAMYKKGATLSEVKEEIGSVQFNVLGELEKAGFKIKKTEVEGKNGRSATEYKVLPKGK